jgi:hypothetical protein
MQWSVVTRWYLKYSGLVLPFIQQLWQRETPVPTGQTVNYGFYCDFFGDCVKMCEYVAPKLHNEELYGLYSPNIVRGIKARIMKWAGHVTRMGERGGVYKFLVGKLEGKKPLGRSRLRWEDIKMVLQEVGYGVWTGSSWLRIETGGGYL